jgi:nucleotide-binding universal stress UspA family protein
MLKLESILFPTDFSKPSMYAFEAAAALARDHGARLVILHVTPPMVVYGEMIPPPPPSPEETVSKIWEAFHNLEAADPKVRDLRVETRVEEGDPAYGILAVAKEIGAGMIVMGTHGRTGIRRLLMGSVAEEVLRKAPCPVMTVKGPVAVTAETTEFVGAATGK